MSDDFGDILNWRRMDARLSTSGQPTESQLRRLREAGVEHIINLAPSDSPDALPGEDTIIAELKMDYIHLPVDFDAPSDGDFIAFCNALDRCAGTRVHVHCIYNARVSAFMLRRAMRQDPDAVESARQVMETIWRPGGVWAAFIGNDADIPLPNRYAGYDY